MEYIQDGKCGQEKLELGELGPIEDSELVVRIVKAPQHVNLKTKQVRPGLFSFSDITQKGVSVVRSEKIDRDRLSAYVTAIVAMKGDQTLSGLKSAAAGEVRNIRLANGGRAFCVLEDPASGIHSVPDNPAHAVAISSTIVSEKDKIIELQTELLRVFSGDFSL